MRRPHMAAVGVHARRIGGHGLGAPELGDQREIGRHQHANQLVGNRDAVNVEGLLAVEGQGQRNGFPGLQPPLLVREA